MLQNIYILNNCSFEPSNNNNNNKNKVKIKYKGLYTLKNARLFQPNFQSNMD